MSEVITPGHPATAVWTADYWQPLICVLYLFGLSLLSAMLSRRMPGSGLGWRQISMPKLAIVLILLDSYVFVFFAGLLTLGVGTSRSGLACGVGVWICIAFYASTKLFITFFLIERIHIVHGGLTPRRRSKLYLSNIAICSMWVVVLIVFIIVKNRGEIRSTDGSCVYHLDHSAAYGAAALDLFIDSYFSLLFAVPLYRGKWSNSRLRWIAIKSLLAAMVSMACSVANLLVIAVLHGRELSWLCLASCTLDTLANAAILFYITRTESPKSTRKAVVPAHNNGHVPTGLSTHAPAPMPGFLPQHQRAQNPAHTYTIERPFPSTILTPEAPPFTNYEGYVPHEILPATGGGGLPGIVEPWEEKGYEDDGGDFPSGVRVGELSPQVEMGEVEKGSKGEKGGGRSKLFHRLFSSPSSPGAGSNGVGTSSSRSRFGLGVGLGTGASAAGGESPGQLGGADNPAAWRGDVRAEYRASPSPNPSALRGGEVWSPSVSGGAGGASWGR